MAVEFIFLAALLDAIDGRVARALKAESKIGGQLDSLADFFNFGIAPIMMIYFWQLNEIERLGWLVVILYTVCTALRLAKFNVLQDALSSDDGETMPIWTQNFFVGVPSPVAGILSKYAAHKISIIIQGKVDNAPAMSTNVRIIEIK